MRVASLVAVACLTFVLGVVGAGPVAAAEPAPNPPIEKACGLDITLVLDASGSVSSANAVDDVSAAAEAFLDSLEDTGSTARVIQFATVAEVLAARAQVTAASNESNGTFGQAVADYYSPKPPIPGGVQVHDFEGGNVPPGSWSNSSSDQWTNWNQVLDVAEDDPGDLVLFITDGDPTAYDFNRPGDPFLQPAPYDVGIGTDRNSSAAASTLDRAIQSANGIKGPGKEARILALGVGAALQNQSSVNRLIQVSGPDVADTPDEFDVGETDVALVRDFDDLAVAVRGLVLELCSPSLTIRKFAQTATNASYQPAPGWDLTVTPSATDGTFTWVLPETLAGTPGGTTPSATLPTDGDGLAQFQWEPDPADSESTALVEEVLEPGYVPGRPGVDNDFRCVLKDAAGNEREVTGELDLDPGPNPSFTLDPIGEEIVTCQLYNSFDYAPAIELTKVNDPTEVRGDLDPPAKVTSTYEATNTGNTPLHDMTITDDRCGPINEVVQPGTELNIGDVNDNELFDPGETWEATCVREAKASQDPAGGITVTNTATVQGTDPTGTVVDDDAFDDATVFVPGVELTKLVNGEESVTVESGTEVTYTYAVENTGNTPLGSPMLVDNTPPCEEPTLDEPAGDGDDILDVGETWTYSCTAEPTDSVVNTATVTATPLNPNDGNEPFPGDNPDVTDTDTAAVTTFTPGLELEKTVDQSVVFPGTDVTYTYRAENTGDTDLADSALVDNTPPCEAPTRGSDDPGNDDDILNVGETWTFTCTAAIDEPTINTATFTAQPVDDNGDPVGGELESEDTAEVEVVSPGIDVIKTALVPVVLDSGAEPVSGPDVPDPRPAEYIYEVANTGTVPIADVVLTDDKCGDPTFVDGDTNGDGNLDVDEVWNYTCSTPLEREQGTPPPLGAESALVTNTATVTGTPFLPGDPAVTAPDVTDTDIAQVEVIEPSLTLTKTASADVVRADGEVTYTFAVENTGDVGLRISDPVDDKCAPLVYVEGDDNDNDLVDGADSGAAESWIYTCTRSIGLPPDGGTLDTNTASVRGVDPLGNTYEAEATAEVRVIDPAIQLVKTVSEPLVPAGTEVTYSFEVTNVGTSPVAADDVLANVTLLDVASPPLPDCRTPALVAKEDGNQDEFLDRDPLETWRYECTGTINDPTNNLAVVGALGGTQFGLQLPVVDLDTAFVQPFHPGIEVVKTADPTTLLGPGEVTYTYQVRNTGDVPLGGVAERITDDTCSPVAYVSGDEDADGLLDTPTSIFEDARDETWTFTCTTTVTETTTNVVTVPGTPTDPGGGPLCGTALAPGLRSTAAPALTAAAAIAQVIAPCDVTGQGTTTVTVVQPGTVTIVKKTTTPSATAFDFTFGSQSFKLSNGQSMTITQVPPGSHAVVEVVPAGWNLKGIACSDPTSDSSVDVAAARASVAVAESENVSCTFTNAAIPPTTGILPNTGLGFDWQVPATGLALVVAGALLLVSVRRRDGLPPA